MARARTPMKSRPRSSAMAYVNSPATVDRMFPPHAEFVSRNRKHRVNPAASAGPGNGAPRSRSDAYAQAGSATGPSVVTSLKATPIGTARESSAIKANGSGK
jgi:hypothetical protein